MALGTAFSQSRLRVLGHSSDTGLSDSGGRYDAQRGPDRRRWTDRLGSRAVVDQARRLDQDAGKQVGQILTGQRFYFDKISFIQPVPRANGRKNLCRNSQTETRSAHRARPARDRCCRAPADHRPLS
jgi:hypothetical protein